MEKVLLLILLQYNWQQFYFKMLPLKRSPYFLPYSYRFICFYMILKYPKNDSFLTVIFPHDLFTSMGNIMYWYTWYLYRFKLNKITFSYFIFRYTCIQHHENHMCYTWLHVIWELYKNLSKNIYVLNFSITLFNVKKKYCFNKLI